MELEAGKQKFIMYIKKYRYMALSLIIGILVMLIPNGETEQPVVTPTDIPEKIEFEDRLSQILSQIDGVGKTKVLLTEAYGSETIFQTDSGHSEFDLDTVILTDRNREESGLVKQVVPPVYRGALVVCRGGDSASVRLRVVEAVKSVTGLPTDRITVLKMK